MMNHVHLLLKPESVSGVGQFMKRLQVGKQDILTVLRQGEVLYGKADKNPVLLARKAIF